MFWIVSYSLKLPYLNLPPSDPPLHDRMLCPYMLEAGPCNWQQAVSAHEQLMGEHHQQLVELTAQVTNFPKHLQLSCSPTALFL